MTFLGFLLRRRALHKPIRALSKNNWRCEWLGRERKGFFRL